MVRLSGVLDSRVGAMLQTEGFAVARAWLPAHLCRRVLSDIMELESLGLLSECGLGREGTVDTGVRRSRMLDLYNWDLCGTRQVHSNAMGCPNTRDELCQSISMLREQLNAQGSAGYVGELAAFETETHYLSYPPGGLYRRHRDVAVHHTNLGWSRMGREVKDGGSFGGVEVRRAISFLIYLNSDWEEADGGALRIYEHAVAADDEHTALAAAGKPSGTLDIFPEEGKLVLFDSCAIEHEVLRTLRSRQCIVGWFRTIRTRGDTRIPAEVRLG